MNYSFNHNFASYGASSMVEKDKATSYIDFCYYDVVSKMQLVEMF